MNPLAKYLEQKNESPSSFAKRSGIPQPTVWRIANSKVRHVLPYTAKAIEKATDGQVTKEELLWPD